MGVVIVNGSKGVIISRVGDYVLIKFDFGQFVFNYLTIHKQP